MTGAAATTGRRSLLRLRLTHEATGGTLLLAAAVLALIWANSPWAGGYEALADFRIGPGYGELDLPLTRWAAEGLLAVFYFVVGLELKHELVAGSLRNRREAAVPVIAAVGAMTVPAAVYVAVAVAAGAPAGFHGWVIPMATDLVFGLAVLAVFGRGLPIVLRTFLLVLAVVTDLIAIVLVAVFTADRLQILALVPALIAVEIFRQLWCSRQPRWWLLLPLAVVAWGCILVSGIHATLAGVLLSFAIPALPLHGEKEGRVLKVERMLRPWSNLLVLPVFAFLTAGVRLVDGAMSEVDAAIVLAISAALVLGTLAGVLGTTVLVTQVSPLRLPSGMGLRDLLPIGLLAGIGFSVSLLFTELAMPIELHDSAKLGTILGSLCAAGLAALTLRWDARQARRRDMNDDGMDDRLCPAIGTDEVLDLLLESERATTRR